MLVSIFLALLGFGVLIVGANWLVSGSASLAKKFRVSDLAIGLTVVSFGTSAPEFVVTLMASIGGFSDIAIGNVIGSNNMNLFIILGLSGLIIPLKVQESTVWKEIPIFLGVTVLVLLLLNDFLFIPTPWMSRMDGSILMVIFVLFLWYVFKQLKQDDTSHNQLAPKSGLRIWSLIIFGLGSLIWGGHLVVTHCIIIAQQLGVSEKIIGLTIVAMGTSLPELVTSVVAALKKSSDIAIGNVIGSNIFNLLFVLSLSGIITPFSYNPRFNIDFFILIGGIVFLFLAMLMGRRKQLERWEAGMLFLFYVGYIAFMVMQEF